ncbi:hypothetical protein BT93_F0955 [Corymbia citriodora subsp. variegata]|nr:hypothetical protein BT93_F0955 [Corymbia citriodora subsp. variegata]
MDHETGRSRGFGFVTYTSSEEASSAIQALDGQMGRVDGYNPQNARKDSAFAWTDVFEKQSSALVTGQYITFILNLGLMIFLS